MKIFIKIIFLISISNSVFSNETEVIDLHETKSLDQMVLDNINEEEDIEDIVENTNENDEIAINEVEVKKIEIVKDNFYNNNTTSDLKKLSVIGLKWLYSFFLYNLVVEHPI